MDLRVRLVVAIIFGFSFIIELAGVSGLLMAGQWSSLPSFEQGLLIFGIVVEFCGVLLAAWAYQDRRKIEELWRVVFNEHKLSQGEIGTELDE